MIVRVFGAGKLPASARRPRLIAAAARAALGPAARKPGELNIVFLDRRAMRKINRRFLGHDWDTDVIAFPYPPTPPLPHKGGGKSKGGGPFGDIFISADQARKQAAELGHRPRTEVMTLAIHGALHLAGHEDTTAAGKRRMFARQEGLVRRLRA
ncbi:MAG: rRNA maturation RNase YbeY [Elusimicrobia bacterium]|nr:rRNA maturation RNase YbeY [Elusimicrobiota bacterium]